MGRSLLLDDDNCRLVIDSIEEIFTFGPEQEQAGKYSLLETSERAFILKKTRRALYLFMNKSL